MNRRGFLSAVGLSALTGLSGCGEGSGSSGSSGGSPCREKEVMDEFDTYVAGGGYSYRIDLESGQELEIEAVRTGDGARPKVEVEDPRGSTIVEVGPKQNIRRTVTARSDGTHYIRFVNEARVTSGTWDTTITFRTSGC